MKYFYPKIVKVSYLTFEVLKIKSDWWNSIFNLEPKTERSDNVF